MVMIPIFLRFCWEGENLLWIETPMSLPTLITLIWLVSSLGICKKNPNRKGILADWDGTHWWAMGDDGNGGGRDS